MIFDESHIRFDFDNAFWPAQIKIDNHVVHQSMKKHLNGCKAVDFVSACDTTLLFLEVKNYINGFPSNISETQNAEQVSDQVAKKVHSSIAIVATGYRTDSFVDLGYWQIVSKKLADLECEFEVCFLLEQPDWQNPLRARTGLGIFNRKLKQKLQWLTLNVRVCSLSDLNINGLTAHII